MDPQTVNIEACPLFFSEGGPANRQYRGLSSFLFLVKAAGADLKTDPRNQGDVVNHDGPHSVDYNQQVQDRMHEAWNGIEAEVQEAEPEVGRQIANEALGKVIEGIWTDIDNGTLRPYEDRDVWRAPKD